MAGSQVQAVGTPGWLGAFAMAMILPIFVDHTDVFSAHDYVSSVL